MDTPGVYVVLDSSVVLIDQCWWARGNGNLMWSAWQFGYQHFGLLVI